MRDEDVQGDPAGPYGLADPHFYTTALLSWTHGGDEPDEERIAFVERSIDRWRRLDWGTVDLRQQDQNNTLVAKNVPGKVLGEYPVPPELRPDAPALVIYTEPGEQYTIYPDQDPRHVDKVLATVVEWEPTGEGCVATDMGSNLH